MIDAHAEAEILFPGVYRKRPADRAGGRAAGRDRGTGFRAVFQFRLRRTAAASATDTTPAKQRAARRRLVRRRSVRAIPAAGAEADREFFQSTAAREARD